MLPDSPRFDTLDRRDVVETLNREFERFDAGYRPSKAGFAREIDALKACFDAAHQTSGSPLIASEQILKEVVWLHHYTADWDSLRARIEDLRRSLAEPELSSPRQRSPTQGSRGGFGIATTRFFSDLDATTDAVQAVASPVPLWFMAWILNPGRLGAYLQRLLVSDIRRTGNNARGELAAVEASLLQFFNKPGMRALLASPALWGGLDEAGVAVRLQSVVDGFADFIEQTQHPRTGYWGPWYLIGGELHQLHDLSFTFHAVRYRDPRTVSRWPQIVETTLAIRSLDYPYGWKPSDNASRYSNHHNTDVVELLRDGFAAVTPSTQRRIGDAVFEILDWCLTQSLTPSLDDFAPVDETDDVDRYYFGVIFLEEVGYWADPPFWWDGARVRPERWPAPVAVARALLPAVAKLDPARSEVQDLRALLTEVVERSARRSPADPVPSS